MNRWLRRILPLALLWLAGCASLPVPPASTPVPTPAPAESPARPRAAEPTPPVAPTQPAPPSAPTAPLSPHKRFVAALAESDCSAVGPDDHGPFTPRHVERVLEARGDVFNFLVEQFSAHGLPGEFAVIPLMESAYRPDPGNRGEVRGLWQFSAGTARHFGLHIQPGWDERLSAPRATSAAIHHLGDMWREWQDWRLAAIGFNAGQYAVTRALRRHPERAKQPDRLGLPRHALAYARRLHALACMIAHTPALADRVDAFAGEPLQVASGWRGAPSLAALADALALPVEQLRLLNPLLASGHWSALRSQPLLLPATAAVNLAQVAPVPETTSRASEAAPQEHSVRRGDSLWRIARHYGVSVQQLVHWNRLDPNIPLRIGQRLRLAP